MAELFGVRVFLGLGSNIEPARHLRQALQMLDERVQHLARSPVYRNPPLGFSGPDFLNLVVAFCFGGTLPDLREMLKDIESSCGRRRGEECGMGSRTLDIDILMFGDLSGDCAGVRLPRPDVYECEFVWRPLLELMDGLQDLTRFEQALRQSLGCSFGSALESTSSMCLTSLDGSAVGPAKMG